MQVFKYKPVYFWVCCIVYIVLSLVLFFYWLYKNKAQKVACKITGAKTFNIQQLERLGRRTTLTEMTELSFFLYFQSYGFYRTKSMVLFWFLLRFKSSDSFPNKIIFQNCCGHSFMHGLMQCNLLLLFSHSLCHSEF